jgi:hypothetical protein
VRPHSIIRTLAAAALIAVPSIAMAAPDQNTSNNGCNGQWVNGQCVNNGQWNNGRGNNNGNWQGRDRDRAERDRAERERERQRERDRWQREHNGQYNNGQYNNGQYNGGYGNGQYNGGYNNGGYGNGQYNGGYNNGNRGNQLTGTVSSFSPYNLYLNNNVHVVLHNGTVINPTGTNLTPGQRVRVIGYRQSDGTFAASEIDVVGTSGYNRYLR